VFDLGDRMKNIISALISAFTLLVASGGVSSAQDFDKGLKGAQNGNFATALREFRPLAVQGHADAQYNLALMYEHGRGVTQDDKEAVKWYRKAAEQAYASAQYNLGVMYEHGRGVPQDDKEAVKWYRKAAEQGYANAQYNLGVMYAKGQGVIQGNVYAHMWLNISASQGQANAVKGRDIVAGFMTTSQVAKSHELARECVERQLKGC